MNSPNYIVLDGAKLDQNLDQALIFNKDNLCLFSGKGEEYLQPVSPFLFGFTKGSEFEIFFCTKGWGHSWGILIKSNLLFAEIYKHLRKLILVKTEEGEEMYFRFYDPRVLRIFLPTCYKEQLKEFFGPINHFVCEDEDPSYALIFSLSNGELMTERVLSSTILNFPLENQQPQVLPQEKKDEEPPKRKWRFIVE